MKRLLTLCLLLLALAPFVKAQDLLVGFVPYYDTVTVDSIETITFEKEVYGLKVAYYDTTDVDTIKFYASCERAELSPYKLRDGTYFGYNVWHVLLGAKPTSIGTYGSAVSNAKELFHDYSFWDDNFLVPVENITIWGWYGAGAANPGDSTAVMELTGWVRE